MQGEVAAAALVAFLPSAPAHAEPTIPEVEKQIDEAWVKLEPVIEQYNKVIRLSGSNQNEPILLKAREAMSEIMELLS